MRRLSGTIQVGSKCNHKGLHKREAEGDLETERKGLMTMEIELGVMCFRDGGKVTSQEIPAAIRSWKRQRNEFFPQRLRKEPVLLNETDFILLTSRTLKDKLVLF